MVDHNAKRNSVPRSWLRCDGVFVRPWQGSLKKTFCQHVGLFNPPTMLSSFAAFAHAVTSQTLQLLYSLIPGQQAALQVVVFVIEITLFSVFLLLFLCACVALVLCLLLNIAVLLHPCLRGRIAGASLSLLLALTTICAHGCPHCTSRVYSSSARSHR